jgi:protein O-GlcNAc transferase
MGAPFVPYLLADAKGAPPSLRPFYSERFVWLPNTYLPTSHAHFDPVPEPLSHPSAVLSLGSFNRPQKLDPELFGSWIGATIRSAAGRLGQAQALYGSLKQLTDEVSARGLPTSRFFATPVAHPRSKYLQMLHDTDLVMDARVFSGATTNLDALWSGTPVVAISGQNLVTRPGVSYRSSLNRCGVVVVSTLREYEDAVVALSTES